MNSSGKFRSEFDEHIYNLSLDGCDEEAGSSAESGWVGLLCDLSPEQDVPGYIKDKPDYIFSCVLTEDTQGFVEVYVFSTCKEAETAFDLISEDYLEPSM